MRTAKKILYILLFLNLYLNIVYIIYAVYLPDSFWSSYKSIIFENNFNQTAKVVVGYKSSNSFIPINDMNHEYDFILDIRKNREKKGKFSLPSPSEIDSIYILMNINNENYMKIYGMYNIPDLIDLYELKHPISSIDISFNNYYYISRAFIYLLNYVLIIILLIKKKYKLAILPLIVGIYNSYHISIIFYNILSI